MKKLLFFPAILLFLTVVDLCASPVLGNNRWRNDDGDDATATWATDENDSLIQANEGNIRLRMEVCHWSGAPISHVAYLYYASMSDTVWHQVSDNASGAFIFYDSENLTNGAATESNKLTSADESCTSENGLIRENTGAFSLSLGTEVRKEYEFSIKPTANAEWDQTYLFLINDEDASTAIMLFTPEICPRMHLEKPVLTITANDASRPQGQDNPEFTLSFSGFVDGDTEADLDELPSLICEANTSSEMGDYDIVPYGGSDNKYEYNLVAGTLTVTEPSALGSRHDKVFIYPNPCTDKLYIQAEGKSARVMDLSGRILMERNIQNGAIDVNELRQGIYLLEVDNSIYKFIKE